jgi:hypothetical protein
MWLLPFLSVNSHRQVNRWRCARGRCREDDNVDEGRWRRDESTRRSGRLPLRGLASEDGAPSSLNEVRAGPTGKTIVRAGEEVQRLDHSGVAEL